MHRSRLWHAFRLLCGLVYKDVRVTCVALYRERLARPSNSIHRGAYRKPPKGSGGEWRSVRVSLVYDGVQIVTQLDPPLVAGYSRDLMANLTVRTSIGHFSGRLGCPFVPIIDITELCLKPLHPIDVSFGRYARRIDRLNILAFLVQCISK